MIPGGSGGVKRPLLSKVPVAAAETGGDIAGKVFRTFITVFFLAVLGGTLFFAISTFLDNRTQDTRLDANQVAIESEVVIRAAAVDALTATDALLQSEVNDRISTLNWVHGDNTTHNVDLTVNGTGLTIVSNHTLHQVILTNEAILDINGVFPTEGSGSLMLDGTGMIDIISAGNISTITVDGSMIVTQLSNLQAQVSMQQVEILELQTNQTQVQTVVDALVAALSAISGGMNGTQDLNMTITQLVVNVTMATIQIAQLQAQVANLTMNEPMPGMLIPWGGASGGPYPAGWLLCDGSEYPITNYPALYAVIGTMYCPGPCSSVNVFAVPDLRGRTIVHKGGVVLNTAIGTKYGEETHTLSLGELATHNHGGSTTGGGAHAHGWWLATGMGTHACTNGQPCQCDNGANCATQGYSTGGYRCDYIPAGAGYQVQTNIMPTDCGNAWSTSDAYMYMNTGYDATNGAYPADPGGLHSHGIPNAGSGTPHNNIQPSMVMQYLIKV
jgi:microcystin-dependent protein